MVLEKCGGGGGDDGENSTMTGFFSVLIKC